MSKRGDMANIGGLKRWGVPLLGCERYLKGLQSAEEGRYDINTQMGGR